MQYSVELERTIFEHREVLDPLLPHYSTPYPPVDLFRRAAEALNPITCEGIYTLMLQLLTNHIEIYHHYLEHRGA